MASVTFCQIQPAPKGPRSVNLSRSGHGHVVAVPFGRDGDYEHVLQRRLQRQQLKRSQAKSLMLTLFMNKAAKLNMLDGFAVGRKYVVSRRGATKVGR
jgi:hypothetical protein